MSTSSERFINERGRNIALHVTTNLPPDVDPADYRADFDAPRPAPFTSVRIEMESVYSRADWTMTHREAVHLRDAINRMID